MSSSTKGVQSTDKNGVTKTTDSRQATAKHDAPTMTDAKHAHSRGHASAPKVHIQPGRIDFAETVKEVGFVKARQLLAQQANREQQKRVDVADAKLFAVKRESRLVEAVRLSNTLGAPSEENPIDKVIEAAARPVTRAEGQTEEEATRAFDTDVAFRRAMFATHRDLLLPQMQLTHFPSGMADTFYLQTGFISKIRCVHLLMYMC